MSLRLIDTGLWVQFLRRRGDTAHSTRVRALIEANDAAWCDVVRLELWHGATSDFDRQAMTDLERVIPSLPIDDEVWTSAIRSAASARRAGLQVPIADHLISACANVYGVPLEHADRHFDLLSKLSDLK